jgi:hypothetical protein
MSRLKKAHLGIFFGTGMAIRDGMWHFGWVDATVA